MTITYNASWLKGSYEKDALNFIGWFENPDLMKYGANLGAHFEGTSIAIGYGYDLIQNVGRAKADLANVGVTITNTQVTLLNQAAAADNRTPAGKTLRKSIATRLANGGVVLPSVMAAENLFQNVRVDLYEKRLDTYLKNNGFTGTLPPSRERLALLSLVYAGHLTNRDSKGNNPARCTLTGIAQGLQAGNRQEVWFWIRYRSNYARDSATEARNKGGYTTRAYAESELFGVFDNEDTATLTEVQNIYKILQAHRKEIFDYELSWGTDPKSSNYNTPTKRIAAANINFELTGDYIVQTLVMELNPAKTVLLADLRNQYQNKPEFAQLAQRLTDGNVVSTSIYMSPSQAGTVKPYTILSAIPYETGLYQTTGSNDLMVGSDGSDELYGGRGDDVLLGGKGNDYLEGDEGSDVLVGGDDNDWLDGGAGNNYLYGGSGNDTYWIKLDNGGHDYIYDSDRKGSIVIADQNGNILTDNVLKTFYKQGNNIWARRFTLENNSAWYDAILDTVASTITITSEANAAITIELGDSFQPGDFGINLIDGPVDPNPTNTIYGTSDNDHLYDTPSDDLIDGGQGDDTIEAISGGNNELSGGEGHDALGSYAANSKDLIEGGTGNDILFGGPDDDQIFGEYEGEMDNLITAGETAPSINIKGDLASGGTGNDFIYTSDTNDLLLGGEGLDLLTGSGGSDVILGDAEYTTAFGDWSVIIDNGSLSFVNVGVVENDTAGDDVVYAGTGNDVVWGEGGDDEIYGGDIILSRQELRYWNIWQGFSKQDKSRRSWYE